MQPLPRPAGAAFCWGPSLGLGVSRLLEDIPPIRAADGPTNHGLQASWEKRVLRFWLLIVDSGLGLVSPTTPRPLSTTLLRYTYGLVWWWDWIEFK